MLALILKIKHGNSNEIHTNDYQRCINIHL
jgi:hypothetical protein